MKRIFALVLTSIGACACGPSEPQARNSKPEVREEVGIPRLAPSAFKELPRGIATYLERRGCTIPQSVVETTPHNVISGAFFGPGQKDWAVTCSHKGISAILVFKQDETTPAAELSKFDERQLGPSNAKGIVEFPYKISPVGKREILYYQEAFGGPLPTKIDHQGIDDYYDGKASAIHYFDNGRWLELQGMD